MPGCTATLGQQPTNKTPADSGGVTIGTSAGGVSTITSSSSGRQQTGMDNNCWVNFNMAHTMEVKCLQVMHRRQLLLQQVPRQSSSCESRTGR
jgi:hypothetical protein